MSTIPLELPELLDLPAVPAPTADVPQRTRRLRFRAVLAPLLPTLFLLAFCVAGLSDPPAPPTTSQPATDRGGSPTRLHVPSESAPYLPAVPLTR